MATQAVAGVGVDTVGVAAYLPPGFPGSERRLAVLMAG